MPIWSREVEDPKPPKIHGRPRIGFNTGLFVAIKKVYTQMSSRRVNSLFGVSKEKGYIDTIPNFNLPSTLLNREDLTPILHNLITITASPLKAIEIDFAVDSTGFRTTQFNEYCKEKHNTKKKHKWLKAHVCIGVRTNIITSARITDEDGADSPQFIPLIQETSDNGFSVKEAYGDKAYLSRKNIAFVDDLGGTAYIPFKENSTSKPQGGNHIWRKMFHYFAYNKEEFMNHYHMRSNVESTFASMKKKLGDVLKSRNKTSQINELLCKIIAYNITVLIQEMYELGIEPNFNKVVL